MKFPRQCSFEVGALLKKMIERDVNKWISFEELFNHPLVALNEQALYKPEIIKENPSL